MCILSGVAASTVWCGCVYCQRCLLSGVGCALFQRLVSSGDDTRQSVEVDECCGRLEEAVSLLQTMTHSKTHAIQHRKSAHHCMCIRAMYSDIY